MARDLNTEVLDVAARDYAAQFMLPTVRNRHNSLFAPVAGRGWVLTSMNNFHFEDEFKYIKDAMRGYFGPKALKEFDDEIASAITPYDTGESEHNLKTRLGLDAKGKRIPGAVGTVKVGSVAVGWYYRDHVYKWIGGAKVKVPTRQEVKVLTIERLIGESEEQAIERGQAVFADQGLVVFPMSQYPASMALATRISNEAALGACDYVVDRLDEGTGAAIIRILDGTQATDPDTAIGAQVTLATLVCSDPAFGNAADIAPGARATASAITSDTSADNTGTASWFRASATNDGATSLDDHIDGSVGTGTHDLVLNTVSIVSGATVAISSWTVTMPES